MPDGMTLAEAVDYFLGGWKAEAPPAGTVRSYTRSLRHLERFAQQRGVVLLADLTPDVLRAAVVAKFAAGDQRAPQRALQRAPNFKGGQVAAGQLIYAAKRCMRWLAAQGLQVPDLSTVKAPRVPTRVQTRLTFDEFERLERAILDRPVNPARRRIPHIAIARDLALISVLAETGLRADEACQLTLADVDLKQGWILVHGKGSKERVLSIVGVSEDEDPQRVVRMLDDWIDTRSAIRGARQHPFVWTSTRGHPLSTDELRRVLGRLCLEAGLDGNRPPHTFRRFQFTERYKSRPSSIRRLAARMGWSATSDSMISVYTRGVELELARDRISLLTSRRVRPAAAREAL